MEKWGCSLFPLSIKSCTYGVILYMERYISSYEMIKMHNCNKLTVKVSEQISHTSGSKSEHFAEEPLLA
jgi:hypothetical protein